MTNTAFKDNNNLNYINEEQYSPQQANLINSQKLLLGTELNKLYNNIVKDAGAGILRIFAAPE
jgi:hypothetical protein